MPLVAASRQLGRNPSASCQDEPLCRDCSSMPADPLSRAFDRLDDFVAVQTAHGGRLTAEAVDLLQEAVGVDDVARRLIADRVPPLAKDASVGAVLLGILVGLFAGEEARR